MSLHFNHRNEWTNLSASLESRNAALQKYFRDLGGDVLKWLPKTGLPTP